MPRSIEQLKFGKAALDAALAGAGQRATQDWLFVYGGDGTDGADSDAICAGPGGSSWCGSAGTAVSSSSSR